jgi:DNA repair protein RecO (recombination protein O)
MDWDGPAVVLDARPFGEGDAVVTVMTEAHGLHRGLVRGGNSRAGAPVWQPGNLLVVRWVARLSDQLGGFTGELVHAGAPWPKARCRSASLCRVFFTGWWIWCRGCRWGL